MGFFSSIFRAPEGLTYEDLRKQTERDRFSDYLPWVAYDPESALYLNTDDTLGLAWECCPLSFAGEKVGVILEGILRETLPSGSVLQFILYADDYIEPYIELYKNTKVTDNPVMKKAVENFSDFLREGKKGLKALAGNPLRNFRLFVTVKFSASAKSLAGIDLDSVRTHMEEVLSGSGLYPVPLTAGQLISWTRRFLNPVPWDGKTNELYNDTIEIRRQILNSRFVIRKSYSDIQIGEYASDDSGREEFLPLRIFKCMTPKVFPQEVDLMQSNELFGGIWGVKSDSDQITTPFLYSLNIIFQDLRTKVHTKASLVLQQQAVGSFAPSLMRKKHEYSWASDEVEKGTRFFRIIPTLWLWHASRKTVNSSLEKVRRIWEGQGYIMQQDAGILPVLFILSLPFGLYNAVKTAERLDRDFIAPADTVVAVIPVQADFSGAGDPAMLLAGRKGQVVSLDVFDRRAANHNVLISASTGAGKSFLVNYLVGNYYALGVKVRLVDIGGSYKKMTSLYGAKYLDFTEEADVCINPFANINTEDADDFRGTMSAIANTLHQMIYSATDLPPRETAETEMTLVKQAAEWAYSEMVRSNDLNGIDLVSRYLFEFPRHALEYKDTKYGEEFSSIARRLAFNLREFTSEGRYGRWFNGPSTFDISSDDFVVLELEHLKPQKDLFKVVILQVIDEVTRDLYLGDRSRLSFIVVDEAWQFLKEGVIIKDMIEEGYRRARKYGGSFVIITQSVLDLKQFGSVGDVIRGNSAFKFYMESGDYERARHERLIDYDDFVMQILKSVKTNKPKYSELFLDTPFGFGVVRLIVDNYSYYVYTSSAGEIAEIEAMVRGGIRYEDAIARMVSKYRS